MLLLTCRVGKRVEARLVGQEVETARRCGRDEYEPGEPAGIGERGTQRDRCAETVPEHDRSIDAERLAQGSEVGAVLLDRAAFPCVGTPARTAAQQVEGRVSVTALVESIHERVPRRVVVLKAVNEHEVAVTRTRLPDGQVRTSHRLASHVWTLSPMPYETLPVRGAAVSFGEFDSAVQVHRALLPQTAR